MVIRSTRVVLPSGMQPATVYIRDTRIDRVVPDRDPSATSDRHYAGSSHIHDVGDLVVMPGIVDTHVHVNEPGRTEWEGFETATRAAAAGGVTTIVDMPLNSVPATTTLRALEAKQDAARERARRGRVLGRRRSGQRRRARGARRRRRARLQVLPVAFGRGRVRVRRGSATCARRCRSSQRARPAAAGARGVARGAEAGPDRPRPARLRHVAGVAAAAAPRSRRSRC